MRGRRGHLAALGDGGDEGYELVFFRLFLVRLRGVVFVFFIFVVSVGCSVFRLWSPCFGASRDHPRRAQQLQALERGLAELRCLVVARQPERPCRDRHQIRAHRAGLGAVVGELLKVVARLAQRRLAYGERRGEGRERGSLRVDAGDARGDADAENLGGVQLGRRIQTAHPVTDRSKVPSFTNVRTLRDPSAPSVPVTH